MAEVVLTVLAISRFRSSLSSQFAAAAPPNLAHADDTRPVRDIPLGHMSISAREACEVMTVTAREGSLPRRIRYRIVVEHVQFGSPLFHEWSLRRF
jgi:hypothetical protein